MPSGHAVLKIKSDSMTISRDMWNNGHRVTDSFGKMKRDEPLTERDLRRIKRQMCRDGLEKFRTENDE